MSKQRHIPYIPVYQHISTYTYTYNIYTYNIYIYTYISVGWDLPDQYIYNMYIYICIYVYIMFITIYCTIIFVHQVIIRIYYIPTLHTAMWFILCIWVCPTIGVSSKDASEKDLFPGGRRWGARFLDKHMQNTYRGSPRKIEREYSQCVAIGYNIT
jgi:hypothetical protein